MSVDIHKDLEQAKLGIDQLSVQDIVHKRVIVMRMMYKALEPENVLFAKQIIEYMDTKLQAKTPFIVVH